MLRCPLREKGENLRKLVSCKQVPLFCVSEKRECSPYSRASRTESTKKKTKLLKTRFKSNFLENIYANDLLNKKEHSQVIEEEKVEYIFRKIWGSSRKLKNVIIFTWCFLHLIYAETSKIGLLYIRMNLSSSLPCAHFAMAVNEEDMKM